jgi:HEAT repeat protein
MPAALEHGVMSPDTALAVVEDRERATSDRIAALGALASSVAEQPSIIDHLIEVVRDPSEPADLRVETIGALQAMAFLVQVFAPKRPTYLDALRSIVQDHDPTVRRRALGILSRAKDEYAARRLMEGLEYPSKALVPAAKAIQFLGYDVHAEYFPLLRKIIENPPTLAAKREAIRFLAADPKSRLLLTQILNDKAQPREARKMSALALESLAPDHFASIARKIALDSTEDDRLRATSLSALARFASPDMTPNARTFATRVATLAKQSTSPLLKRATRKFMARTGE